MEAARILACRSLFAGSFNDTGLASQQAPPAILEGEDIGEPTPMFPVMGAPGSEMLVGRRRAAVISLGIARHP
jgi:hypothetical protein